MPRSPQRTCLDCGYLACGTDGEQEVVKGERILLHCLVGGTDAGVPGALHTATCYRSCWTAEILGQGSGVDTTLDELREDRRDCEEFVPLRHGHSPAQHHARAEKREDRRHQVILACFSAFIGATTGAVAALLVNWLSK